MTDSSGTVVWSADYKPFGEATITVSTITNNLRFPGQYFDTETGLNYNYLRDYNTVIGRYVEKDPIGLRGGINLYSFVGNNPMNRIDPSGLWYVDINLTGGTGTWGGTVGIQIGSSGVYVYGGGGYGIGAGTSITMNTGSPSAGVSASETASGGNGAWGGIATVNNDSAGVAGSIGAGWGLGAGFSATVTYTYPLWQIPDSGNNNNNNNNNNKKTC
jgi:RHS repeat-associated protein